MIIGIVLTSTLFDGANCRCPRVETARGCVPELKVDEASE